jgi:hypothetical protein
MDKIYLLFSFSFLAVLFYGYGGFDPVMSLGLTAVSFGASVVGFIRDERTVKL